MLSKTIAALSLLSLASCMQAPLGSVDEMRYFARDRNAANQIDVYAERYTSAKKRATDYRAEAIKLEAELGRIRGLVQQARDANSNASKELNALNAANAKLAAAITAAKAKEAALTNPSAPAKKPAAAPAKKPTVAPKK